MTLFAHLLEQRPDLADQVPVMVGQLVGKFTGYTQVLKFGDLVVNSDGQEVTDYIAWEEPELFEETLAQLVEA